MKINKKKISFFLSVILIGLLVFVIAKGFNMKKSYAADPTNNSFSEEDLNVGQNAKVIESIIVNRKTGTPPFDSNDNPGNDKDENNEIVRSFDQVTWTLENTFGLKNEESSENYYGGVLLAKASIPSEVAGYAKWDLDAMKWLENPTLSDDGTTVEGFYRLPTDEVSVPGKQNTSYVLKILGAPNETEITATFETMLYGNDDEEKISFSDGSVKVSAGPQYNVKLERNTGVSAKTKVDYGEGEISGRMYAYAFLVELYGSSPSKGLKGIEFPKGDIKFNFRVKLERKRENSSTMEDITLQALPILWDYDFNYRTDGHIDGRKLMNFDASGKSYYWYMPKGVVEQNRYISVFNSGKLQMTQNKNLINVKISDYGFDGTYPNSYPGNWTAERAPIYKENEGIFHVGYLQLFVPDKAASTVEQANYYLTVSDESFEATSVSNKKTTSQGVTNDDSVNVQHLIRSAGSYYQHIVPQYDDRDVNMWSSNGAGDSKVTNNQKFRMNYYSTININNDITDVLSATKFVRFDGSCVEPILFDDNSKWQKSSNFKGDMTLNMWFLTKKDGKNWTNQSEMNNAKIEDMKYYANISDVPKGHIIVGEYFESIDGKFVPEYNGMFARYQVKSDVKAGKVCAFTQSTKMWVDKVDRSKYSITKQNFSSWPKPTYDSGNMDYIPIEYDVNGNQIVGTHANGNYNYGQSILVVGSTLAIQKEVTNKTSDGEEKINYDIGKNEFDVTYKLIPSMTNSLGDSNIKGVNLKVEDILPKGMTYVKESCNIGDPIITNNSDGTQSLVWHFNNQTVNQDIKPITFTAHLYEEIENGTQYNNVAIVSEIAQNGVYKVGNAPLHNSERMATKAIQVINLTSYGLYKTVEKPIIERNENDMYKVVASNKTEEDVNTFKLLDILPYNKDNRGTSFNGDYIIEKIILRQIDSQTQELIPLNNLNIFITNNKNIRTKKIKDNTVDSIVNTRYISGNDIGSPLTGILITGTLKKQSKVEMEIYIKTNNNKAKDLYVNNVTAITNPDAEPMQSANIKISVIQRSLDGIAWADKNRNGLFDTNEKLLKDINVLLFDDEDNQIAKTKTNEKGYYIFNNLEKKNYKVKVEYDKKLYYLTNKEVGDKKEINSKFSIDNDTTDIITGLDRTDASLIEVNHINAGLIPYSQIIVKYVDINTNKEIASREGSSGKVGEKYSTYKKDIKGYTFVKDSGNTNGDYKEDVIEVIYYYSNNKKPSTPNTPNTIDNIKKHHKAILISLLIISLSSSTIIILKKRKS